MKKVYSKPVVVVDTFLNDDATNALNFISTTIAPKSANLSNKFTKLNSYFRERAVTIVTALFLWIC